MSKTSSSQDFPDLPPRSLLTPDEAADFFRVSRQTVYNWIEWGTLASVKRHGVVRVPASELLKVFRPSTEI